jgi:hypothetical protein
MATILELAKFSRAAYRDTAPDPSVWKMAKKLHLP